VELEQAFVVPEGMAVGRVVSGRGTAWLAATNGGAEPDIETAPLSRILARHPRFQTAKLFKTDTDGLDIAILLGELNLLERLEPVLFFELDPASASKHGASALDLFARLHERGFSNAIFYENTGEYVCAAELDDARLLEDLVRLYSGREGTRYADVCVFHEIDRDLGEAVRRAELAFFERVRSAGGNCL
jgi:hypothetical protein